jgi:hypothetical protein
MSSEKIAKKSYLEFSYLNPSLLLLLFLLPLIIQFLSLVSSVFQVSAYPAGQPNPFC